jgi:hypothetical protein
VFAKQWLRDNRIAESNFDAILCRMTVTQVIELLPCGAPPANSCSESMASNL